MTRQNTAGRKGWTKITSWVAVLSFVLTVVFPLPALAGDAVFYYHNDATGSPVAITNSAGTKVWGADYEPFGELAGVVETVPNSQQFLAKTVDPETSLHLLGARYYDGKIGRFLSVDAGLLRGQQAAMLGRAQFHNVYAYSANNPNRFLDPTGDTPIDVVFLAIDVATLGVAVYTGVGIASAVVDVGLSAAGVISPVPGVGEVLKAGRAVGHVADIVKVSAGELRSAGRADFRASRAEALAKANDKNNGKCFYCGINKAAQGDHVKSLKSFADDVNAGKISRADAIKQASAPENIVGACLQCNTSKGAKQLSVTDGPGKWVAPNRFK